MSTRVCRFCGERVPLPCQREGTPQECLYGHKDKGKRSMTREQAVERIKARIISRAPHVVDLVRESIEIGWILDAIEALGLIKFDEPETEEDTIFKALKDGARRAAGLTTSSQIAGAISGALTAAGFEIRRKA